MALSSISLKVARDSWLGWLISAASLTLLLLFGMAVYRDIDLTVYTELPEAFRSLLGIGENVDVGGLAIGYVFRIVRRPGGGRYGARHGQRGDRG